MTKSSFLSVEKNRHSCVKYTYILVRKLNYVYLYGYVMNIDGVYTDAVAQSSVRERFFYLPDRTFLSPYTALLFKFLFTHSSFAKLRVFPGLEGYFVLPDEEHPFSQFAEVL